MGKFLVFKEVGAKAENFFNEDQGRIKTKEEKIFVVSEGVSIMPSQKVGKILNGASLGKVERGRISVKANLGK